MAHLFGDWAFQLPSERLADAQSSHGRVYAYELAWVSPGAGGLWGAGHVLDIPLVFDTCETDVGKYLTGTHRRHAWGVGRFFHQRAARSQRHPRLACVRADDESEDEVRRNERALPRSGVASTRHLGWSSLTLRHTAQSMIRTTLPGFARRSNCRSASA